jgi:hypothetical protein
MSRTRTQALGKMGGLKSIILVARFNQFERF